MANLYQIDQGILECLDFETGEIIDPERLESLQMERNQKIENVACWIKNLLSDAEAIKAEKDALADREAKCRKKAEDLKKWLGIALEGQKFNSARCAVSFRRSEAVEITDENIIPQVLMVQTVSFKPDKKAIKELLKAGQEISGCRLVENQNVQIK
jgi:hypothetical protein